MIPTLIIIVNKDCIGSIFELLLKHDIKYSPSNCNW